MIVQNWPTQQDDMAMALEILQRHGDKAQTTPLMSTKDTGNGETMEFSPAPWLAELVKNLIARHGEQRGMEILRLILRELGVFKRGNA